MGKSKHNPVYEHGQHGNAAMTIEKLLPVGKSNAIRTNELMKMICCSSERELRARIAEERMNGAVICSTSSGGYFLPADRQELLTFCKSMESRARNTFLAIQSARRASNMPEGQQHLEEIDGDGCGKK